MWRRVIGFIYEYRHRKLDSGASVDLANGPSVISLIIFQYVWVFFYSYLIKILYKKNFQYLDLSLYIKTIWKVSGPIENANCL